MPFPKIERAIHDSKKEHAQMLGYAVLKLIESLVFIGSLGFFHVELGRPYLAWLDE